MTTRTKKLAYLTVGLAISGILIWMLFRNIDMQKLLLALKQAG